jgi:hypothetical protein
MFCLIQVIFREILNRIQFDKNYLFCFIYISVNMTGNIRFLTVHIHYCYYLCLKFIYIIYYSLTGFNRIKVFLLQLFLSIILPLFFHLNSCFSISFSSRNPKKLQKILRDPCLYTLSQKLNKLPAFFYHLYALHVKNEITYF